MLRFYFCSGVECNQNSWLCKASNSFIRCNLAFLVVFVLITLSSCKTGQIEKGASVSHPLQSRILYDAIEERNFHALWDLKDHSDPRISEMAFQGMIHAKEIPVDLLVEETLSSGNPALWRVLSYQTLDMSQLARLNRELSMNTLYLPGLCKVIARQGNPESLRILSEDPELIRNEERCSYAAGYLLASVPAEEEVVERFFSDLSVDGDAVDAGEGEAGGLKDDRSQTATHLYYGLYRSDINRPAPGSALFDQLADYLRQRQGNLTLTDEYLVRITAPESIKIILDNRDKSLLYSNVQVSIELASAIASLDASHLNPHHIQTLADHPNPHVQVQLLESLLAFEELPPDVMDLMTEREPDFKRHPETAIAYFKLLSNNSHELTVEIDEIEAMLTEAPYFADQIFELLSGGMDSQRYLEILTSHLAEEGVVALHASASLNRFVQGRALSGDDAAAIQRALMNAVESGNRSVLSGGQDLYLDLRFLSDSDLKKISEIYREMASEPNTGLATALYSILQETSTADPFTEPVRKPFRSPDRLFSTDDVPLWILETEHGEIVIELDPNTAPYTVSSIIYLTEAGAYDGVVMHRVVRNFVIQGGDFDLKDGFGGPDYRIPTEPGIHTFLKGSVGIASSGTDTEGSQFFITLTPTPHLDGNYTNFGNVRSGMDIAESIQKGDRILRAAIE